MANIGLGGTNLPPMSNPRGYAYVSFVRSYDKILSWDWGAAAKVHGQMLDRVEWVGNGMGLYDRWPDAEDTRTVVKTIIKLMGDQIRQDHIGLIGRRRTEHGTECYPKYGALPEGFDAAEDGVADEVVNVDELAWRLRELSKHLTSTQLEMVGRYIQLDAPTFIELAHDLGYTPNYVTKVFTQVRKTAERIRI